MSQGTKSFNHVHVNKNLISPQEEAEIEHKKYYYITTIKKLY